MQRQGKQTCSSEQRALHGAPAGWGEGVVVSTSFDTSLAEILSRYLVEAHLLCELAAVADAAVLEQLRQEGDENHLAEGEGERFRVGAGLG